ncbi:hypothetical protein H6G36_26960, partial [Anabaena minutissima FACHB-250]|nr:hypothetical protein [Anabaena minutissima FACHB-250]
MKIQFLHINYLLRCTTSIVLFGGIFSFVTLLFTQNSAQANWGAGHREAFRYCVNNGFTSGFPDGEEGRQNGQRVIGVNCLRGTSRFNLPSNVSLGENWGAGHREAFRYCVNNGFTSGFPDGEEGRQNGQRVIGVNCLRGTSRFNLPSNVSL